MSKIEILASVAFILMCLLLNVILLPFYILGMLIALPIGATRVGYEVAVEINSRISNWWRSKFTTVT